MQRCFSSQVYAHGIITVFMYHINKPPLLPFVLRSKVTLDITVELNVVY